MVDTLLLEALSQCLRALRTADGDPDGIDTVRLLTKTSLRMGTLAKKRAHELASYKADRSGPFQSLVGRLSSMQRTMWMHVQTLNPLEYALSYIHEHQRTTDIITGRPLSLSP